MKVSLAEKLALFGEHWTPHTVANLNDYEIKVVKVQGVVPRGVEHKPRNH
jgi:hypothetical protein